MQNLILKTVLYGEYNFLIRKAFSKKVSKRLLAAFLSEFLKYEFLKYE
jgi:hypothetical protein